MALSGQHSIISTRRSKNVDLPVSFGLSGELRAKLEARLLIYDAGIEQLQQELGALNVTGHDGGGAGSSAANAGGSQLLVHDGEQMRSYALSQALHARRLRRKALHSLQVLSLPAAISAKESKEPRGAKMGFGAFAGDHGSASSHLARAGAAATNAPDTAHHGLQKAIIVNEILTVLKNGELAVWPRRFGFSSCSQFGVHADVYAAAGQAKSRRRIGGKILRLSFCIPSV